MVSDQGLNITYCQIKETKDIVALSEEDILPNPSRILAEARDVGNNLVDSKLVEIQAQARVVGGI